MSEAERLVDLRDCIEEFQMRRQPGEGNRTGDSEDEEAVAALSVPDKLEDDDFERLSNYVTCVKPFTSLSKFLGGEKYPTASSLIPALDQIREDLLKLQPKLNDAEASQFLANVIFNFDKRFKDGWKSKCPFNGLCFSDPRYVDLYAQDQEIFQKIIEDSSILVIG